MFETLFQRTRRATTGIAATFALATLTGCAVDDEPFAPLDVQVRALSGTCGGQAGANPFSTISSYTLVVRDEAGKQLYSKAASASGPTLTALDVPAGSGLELTLIGNAGGKPAWMARRSGQKIVKNTTSTFDMTLMQVEAFTCLSPSAGGAPNVLFPSVTSIGKGRVLITGGFGVSNTNGGKTELSGAQDGAWIFDVDTGELREVKNQARMAVPRAGHSAIFLPKSNRVLIVGGAQKMSVDAASGPPVWKVSDGVNYPYEIFDVETETFIKPEAVDFAVKRVFPNLMALSDDFVVALGGAVWPASANIDQTSYMNSSLYDPTVGTHGAFVDVKSQLPLNAVRAGAAIAPLGSTPDGGTKVLVWGGDDDNVRAEVFVESTAPGDGLFDASYTVSGDITALAGGLYFPTLTPIGTAKAKDDPSTTVVQFLSVGGIRYANKAWQAPNKDDVYVVSVNEKTRKIDTERVAGLDAGIYMHQANRTDAGHVVVSGGFTAWGQPASFTLRTFDIAKRTFENPPASATFVKRGGHGALALTNDCVLMFGGVTTFDDLSKTSAAASDIYCPAHLLP